MSTETNISALHAEPLTGAAERSTFKVLLAVSISKNSPLKRSSSIIYERQEAKRWDTTENS
jgi:hypothetical protein